VDTFHDRTKRVFGEIQKEPYEAIWNKALVNPVLHAISTDCSTLSNWCLSWSKPFLHSNGTWLGLQPLQWTAKYKNYIYGSCWGGRTLRVWGFFLGALLTHICRGDQAMYDRLREPACKWVRHFSESQFSSGISKRPLRSVEEFLIPRVAFWSFSTNQPELNWEDIQRASMNS